MSFSYRGASLRAAAVPQRCIPFVIREVKRQRDALERYVRRHPVFRDSLEPVDALPDAPPIARLMAAAARAAGVGPMAAVAGAIAQWAARRAVEQGASEAIVENGGDIALERAAEEVVVALFAGEHPLSGALALRIDPGTLPLGICSSSSRLGHSLSLGDCDLATVTAREAALADAAATHACNLVRRAGDVDRALDRVLSIKGVLGVLIVKGDRVGLAGVLPPLVRHRDAALPSKVSHDPSSGFRWPARGT